MTRIGRGTTLTIVLGVAGAICFAAIFVIAALRREEVRSAVPHPPVSMTKIMMSRVTNEKGFGDWRCSYVQEKSMKASGEYVKRSSYHDGKVETWVAQNNEAIQYWSDNRFPATSRPFSAERLFYNEAWLAEHKNLRRVDPIVEIMGYKTYVLRFEDQDGGYDDQFIAPDIGEILMIYSYSPTKYGTAESLFLTVSIQRDKVNQELWDSIPKGIPVKKLSK